MEWYQISYKLIGKFIVFVNHIFSSAFSANYKLKIMNKNNFRRSYGKSHAHFVSKYVRLSEATTAATADDDLMQQM